VTQAMTRRLTRLAVALLAAALLAPAVARAEPAAGLVGATTLATFDTADPGVVTLRPITGLTLGETVVGIDVRPATGQLYAVTVPMGVIGSALVRTYALDPVTGAATLVGSIPNTVPGAADTQWGLDFNPVVDRIRAVVANGENFRINPNNGSLAGNDVDLTFSGGAVGPIVAAAYDRNTVRPAGSPTTLYEIDRGASRLDVQGGIDGTGPGGPNGGQVTSVGPLGVTLDAGSDAGFDISGATGTAYATLKSGGVARLYTVNLSTGAATAVGSFPADVRDLAILPPPPPLAKPPVIVVPIPPPAPRDTTKPAALIDLASSATFAKLAGSKLSFAFSCSEQCRASAKLAAGRTTLATGSASIAAAGVGTLHLRIATAGKRYLSKRLHPTRRRVRAKLAVTFTDAAGNASKLTRTVTLRR
jgi:uncharacterized protein DUF4394